MVKHTQTIRRLLPMNCLSVFDHFVKAVNYFRKKVLASMFWQGPKYVSEMKLKPKKHKQGSHGSGKKKFLGSLKPLVASRFILKRKKLSLTKKNSKIYEDDVIGNNSKEAEFLTYCLKVDVRKFIRNCYHEQFGEFLWKGHKSSVKMLALGIQKRKLMLILSFLNMGRRFLKCAKTLLTFVNTQK